MVSSSNDFSADDLLAMVYVDHEFNDDPDSPSNGWLTFYPYFLEDGSMWLYVRFTDAVSGDEYVSTYEVFADTLNVERGGTPAV